MSAQQLAELRHIQKIRFHMKMKLGPLLELHPIRRAVYRLTNAIRHRMFPTPINIDSWDDIPGIYRIRLRIGHDNLINWTEQQKNRKVSNEDQLQKALEQSKKEMEEKEMREGMKASLDHSLSTDDLIRLALQQSLEEIQPSIIKRNSLDEDQENDLINIAIQQSLEDSSTMIKDQDQDVLLAKTIVDSFISEPIDEFPNYWMGFDLRYLGPNVDEPLNYNGMQFYLTPEQKTYVRIQWMKVDESCPSGHNFKQMMIYIKSEMIDMEKGGEFAMWHV